MRTSTAHPDHPTATRPPSPEAHDAAGTTSTVGERPFESAFVTGGTGLLGNNLVRLLLERGVRVTILARSTDKARLQFGPLLDDGRLAVVLGDLDEIDAFADAMAGHDVLFHTAAYFRDSYTGGSHRDALHRTNVVGTTRLLEAAYARGIRRAVYTSSIAVLDRPHGAPADAVVDETMLRREEDADDYYRSKIHADRAVLAFLGAHPDFDATIVLPGWMHGPGDGGPTSAGQVVLDFAHGRIPGVVPGSFSVVDSRDVALAQIAAAGRGRRGERYLAAGRHMTMAELFPLLARATGTPAPRRRIPFIMLFALAFVQEVYARFTRRPVLLSLASVRLMAREAGRTRFSATKSAHELGLRFRPVEETLRDEVAWFRERGLLPGQAHR